MSNFSMNVWRYAAEHGKIKIQVKGKANHAVFTVYNKGSLIDEKEKCRIWDIFYQGHSSGRMQEGTDLGLYIAKSIISQHGGLCSVEFGFRIPVIQKKENK